MDATTTKLVEAIGTELYEVCECLDRLNRDIEHMPHWKRLTPFGQDRLAERRRLEVRRQALMDQARALESK
jgi:hypothetical protein